MCYMSYVLLENCFTTGFHGRKCKYPRTTSGKMIQLEIQFLFLTQWRKLAIRKLIIKLYFIHPIQKINLHTKCHLGGFQWKRNIYLCRFCCRFHGLYPFRFRLTISHFNCKAICLSRQCNPASNSGVLRGRHSRLPLNHFPPP